MTTLKQIEANRQNALTSTGPTTLEGKSCSSKNAIKHGLLSNDPVVFGEQLSEYQLFHQNLIDIFFPKGPIEHLLVEKIACYAWRQRRAIQAESALFHNWLSNECNGKSLESIFQGSKGECLQNLTRYEATIEKNFYRALHQLQELQKVRKEAYWNSQPNGFVS